MNNYLDTLIKRTDMSDSTQDELLEKVDETLELTATSALIDAETDATASANGALEECPSIEPTDQNVEDIQETAVDPACFDAGVTVYVSNVKVYNRPDPNTAFKLFTGNIIIMSEVNEMIQIKYMKASFGLVIGYVFKEDIAQ